MLIAFQIVLLIGFIVMSIGVIAEDKKESQYLLGLLSVITMLVLYKSLTL